MEEHTVRSVLRMAAVLVMLLALVLATRTIVATMAVQSELGPVAGRATGLAGWSVAGELATVGWGLVLYAASAALARRIAS